MFFQQKPPQRGYVYAADAEAGAMAGAAPGAVARIAGRGPPWIVVDHELASIVVAKWPGRLWRVEVVDAIRKAEMKAHGGLRDDAPYTRAAAVKVLEEIPVASLFGARGAQVCTVIAAASELTLERAEALPGARHREAGAAQTRVWRRWLSENRVADRYADDLDGTLAISDKRSPVGAGLSVISSQTGRRAEAIAGRAVWIQDPADDEGVWLGEPWLTASLSLLDAALCFGAPEFVADDDRRVLAKAWRDVIGGDP
jgi:hypothetical protein